MAKSKGYAANNQRSNTKNPNNAAYDADRTNRSGMGHANVPPAPPPVVIAPTPELPTKK